MRKYPVSDRQKAFVREYLIDFNARQAAIRAGFPTKGAADYGSRLLRNERIIELLKTQVAEPEAEEKLSREVVIKGVLDIAEGRTPDVTVDHRLKAYALLQKFLGPGNMTQFMKFQAVKAAAAATPAPVVEEKKPEPPPLPPSGSLEAFLSDRKH